MPVDIEEEPGVYAVKAAGGVLVHRYQGGDYRLEDVIANFELGRIDQDNDALVLDAHEVRQLKSMADAYSFDHEEGFIEMCLDIHRYTAESAGVQYETFRFRANF